MDTLQLHSQRWEMLASSLVLVFLLLQGQLRIDT